MSNNSHRFRLVDNTDFKQANGEKMKTEFVLKLSRVNDCIL
jgi:hypothetical protein